MLSYHKPQQHFTVDENFQRVDGHKANKAAFNKLSLYHYVTRSAPRPPPALCMWGLDRTMVRFTLVGLFAMPRHRRAHSLLFVADVPCMLPISQVS
jgi:hypothetical protein